MNKDIKILVVDDHSEMRRIIKELLAEDTAKRAEAVTMQTPLPKSHVQTPPHLRGAVPVVPARVEPKDKIRGLQEGAIDYVTKPQAVEALAARAMTASLAGERSRKDTT